MSVIWKGSRINEGHAVAIKVMKVDKCDMSEEVRIMNEVAILKSVDHPNIMKLHDFF